MKVLKSQNLGLQDHWVAVQVVRGKGKRKEDEE
jgi:hypothetical protein